MGAPLSFHALTIKHNGLVPRIISPTVISPAYDPAHPPTLTPLERTVDALWDTGATGSVITATTANALNLSPIGSVTMNTAGGTRLALTYLINMLLPNRVHLVGVQVSECPDNAGQFGAIIGMDIIARGDLAITNTNGHTWLSFRIPSVEAVDFVQQANRLTYAGVQRNAPCPCGKRRDNGQPVKFKHCHGTMA